MSTFKDILYKKNDDETWTEWSKRVPDWDKLVTNKDEDKLDYIRDTIYAKIYENDKEKASESSAAKEGYKLSDEFNAISAREANVAGDKRGEIFKATPPPAPTPPPPAPAPTPSPTAKAHKKPQEKCHLACLTMKYLFQTFPVGYTR